MRQLRTTWMSAAAAGLTALAVTVAAPAVGDDGAAPDKPGGVIERREGPKPAEIAACLTAKGAEGVPSPTEREGRALKEWIMEHQDDEGVRSALTACDVNFAPPREGGSGKGECGRVSEHARRGA